jgi:hypothetical protein
VFTANPDGWSGIESTALAVHITTNTAFTGATYDIDTTRLAFAGVLLWGIGASLGKT